VAGVVTERRGDAGSTSQPQDGDDQVAQAGHDVGTAGGADLGAVFAEADVADPVEAVFDVQWPRMMAASSAVLAWVTVSEVTA
jgi:hypothetical protein